MIVSHLTVCIGGVAVAALGTVHIIRFRAFFTETATVAKSARTVGAAPAYTAKIIFHYVVTFVTIETVPTVIDIAILAHTALGATLQLFVAGTALVTVGEQETICAGTFGTAGAAHTATVFIPVVMAAEPAFHTVFPVCEDRGRK